MYTLYSIIIIHSFDLYSCIKFNLEVPTCLSGLTAAYALGRNIALSIFTNLKAEQQLT